MISRPERGRAPAVRAGLFAAVVSGAPSTVWAWVRGDDPLAATRAAGRMVVPRGGRFELLSASAVHLVLSLGWAAVIARLPRGRPVIVGAAAGAGIAAVDLGTAHLSRSPRFAAVRALPVGPQVADHVAFGVAVAGRLASGRFWRFGHRSGVRTAKSGDEGGLRGHD